MGANRPRKNMRPTSLTGWDEFGQPTWPTENVYKVMNILEQYDTPSNHDRSWLAIAAYIVVALGLPAKCDK